MYIGSSKMFLNDIASSGDKFMFQHVQDVAPIQRHAEFLRKNSDRGFTQGRTMQHVGIIPDVIYFAHPEWGGEDGADLMYEWLKSDEGAPYRIAQGL